MTPAKEHLVRENNNTESKVRENDTTYPTESDIAKSKEDKLKEMYIQFQQLQQQIEKISEHMEALSEKNNELNVAIAGLVQLGETAVNTEILAPIADGIFLQGELKDNKKLIVNVGAGVAVEKTIPEASRLLEEQRASLLSNFKEAEKILRDLQNQAMQIYEAVNGKETKNTEIAESGE